MKENFTSIVAIVDRSSSMASLAKETIQGFNEFLAEQKKQPGEAVFTLATFASDYTLVHDAVPLDLVPALDESTYRPGGWTALLDAIGTTVNRVGANLAAMKEEDRPSKVLVLIMTDGEENRSREFRHAHVSEMIAHQRDKYSWEFVFIGANQDAITAGASIGIAATNSYNYAATAVGTKSLFRSVSAGVSSYRGATLGSAYVMSDPLNDVDADQLKQTLVGISAQPPVISNAPVTPVDPSKDNS